MSDLRAPDLRLIVVDPGHFHAALVQREMLPGVSPLVRVCAPLGGELLAYLGHVARFNGRAEQPTRWELDLYAGPDSLARMRQEPPGGAVIFSGRGRRKIDQIEAAVESGLHVLCDKPAIIRREDLPRFEAALNAAAARGIVVTDMMTGRVGIMPRLVRALVQDHDVFGEPIAGSLDEPGVVLSGTHHLFKIVAGVVNQRPSWYFDITEQGEGIADTGVHAVDRVHETLFPDEALDYRNDIEVLSARRWPTTMTAEQFQQVTGTAAWPDTLRPWVSGARIDYFCNGRVDYRVRGIHARLETVWGWQAEPGRDDTQAGLFRGTRCNIELRQGEAEDYRPELYVISSTNIGTVLDRFVANRQTEFAGLGVERRGAEWRLVIPAHLRTGHEAQFAQFARRFFDYARDPASVPARDRPNLLAKYFVTTEAVALSHREK